jgi:hypothetical protein
MGTRLKTLVLLTLMWISSQEFRNIDDAVKFLNTLPAERAIEAKIVIVAVRPGMGPIRCHVVYRAEEGGSK